MKLITDIVKKLIPTGFRLKIKRAQRRMRNYFKRGVTKMSLDDMRKLLIDDLGVRKGDNLIISSSFGNLNASFSPVELIKLLQEAVSEDGNLVMPFYPSSNSYEWAMSGQVFDMQKTRSSMGILTQTFSEIPNVHKSIHPTKAVVVWGKNAEEIVSGHAISKTPYHWESPYGWLLKNSSKSLGLGVMNRPIIHACEDILSNETKYLKDKFVLKIKNRAKVFSIETYIHDPKLVVGVDQRTRFIEDFHIPSFEIKKTGFSYSYIFSNQDLFDRWADLVSKNLDLKQ